MFLRFTKKFSRPKLGFIIALLMLFAPALIATTAQSAQRNKTKAASTPKKKATPTPNKKTQAKTKPTPKPTPARSKTNAKNSKQTDSKNKTADKRDNKRDKRNDKNTSAKNNQKNADRNKDSKTAKNKNSKQALAANNRIPSKNAKYDRDSKTRNKKEKNNDRNKNASSKNNKRETVEKNTSRPTTSRNTKPTVAKTTSRRTSKTKNDTKSKTENITEETTENTVEKTPETTTNAVLPEIIVTTFSVPVRSQAKPDAPALERVKLGTVLKVTEKNPAWYKVQYTSGEKNSTGWVSANSVNDLNSAGKMEIYRQIVERNYKPQMDFESSSEFYEFLSSVDGQLDPSDKSAEIELKRLLALRSALKTIPSGKGETEPYGNFIKAQEKEIVYNEPAGQWLVVSNEFWNLHSKYKKYGIADAIAWEAANNPLPGECEGYVNCYLFDMRMRFGEYLNLHPNGKNAGEALKNMTDYLSPIAADASQKKIYNGPTDVTDRAEFNNLIAELRTIVARLSYIEKEKTLQQLRQIAEAYR